MRFWRTLHICFSGSLCILRTVRGESRCYAIRCASLFLSGSLCSRAMESDPVGWQCPVRNPSTWQLIYFPLATHSGNVVWQTQQPTKHNKWGVKNSYLINSLAPVTRVFFKLILWIGILSITGEIGLRWKQQNPIDDKLPLVQVMAWHCQATRHYLSQCWLRSKSPYGFTRPQWVNLGNSYKIFSPHPVTFKKNMFQI